MPHQRLNEMEAKIQTLERKIGWLTIFAIANLAISAAKLLFPQLAIPSHAPATPAPVHQQQNVQLGSTPEPSDHAESYTVRQVAEELDLSERAVITAIDQGRIQPPPTKPGGRAWAIARDYRYLPPTAALSR